MLSVIRCLIDDHDPRLVALAAAICLLATFTAASLLSRAQTASGRHRLLWLVTAAIEFGSGIWSLHFVAMLAFRPGMRAGFDPGATACSVVIAVLGSFGAFALAVSRGRGPARVAGAAALLTLAIGGMHYTGVAAMRLDGTVRIDPDDVLASVGLCFVFSAAAMASIPRLSSVRRQFPTAAMLSLAICGLHFVGMAGLSHTAGSARGMSGPPLGANALALVVAASSTALVLASLGLSIVDRVLCDRACAERARLRKLTAVSFEGLLIEQDGVIVDANERLSEFSGFGLADLIGEPVDAFLRAAGHPAGSAATWRPEGGEHTLRCADGGTMPVELLAESIALDRGPARAVAIRDLTARRDSEAALKRLAHHDPLTGLANRVLLDAHMRQAFEEQPSPMRRGAVLWLDLDRFKPVNDLLGHAAGDRLLVAAASRLSRLLRQSDTLARVGGDEFVILMPDAAEIGACRSLANRIVQSMREPFDIADQQIVVGISIGIALYPQDGQTADELLRCADIAMYRSKEEGRGTYRLFEATMDAELQSRRTLERDLRSAIGSDAFEIYYQPLVNCEAGDIEGYEALLRWHHPTRGFIPPAEFIPIAEESGLILPLGEWVLETACAAAAAWTAPRRIAVNLSPAQFKQIDLLERITGVLDRTGLVADRLELEVTEGVLIDEPARAVALLSALRSRGVRVSLDDFGTGYSSLSYLRQFPLDKIKIDRSFIGDLGADERSASIVRAVVALAHSLGLAVTAEGVETEIQLDLLQRQLCNQVQGYLLGRPAPLAPADGVSAPAVEAVEAVGGGGRRSRRAERSVPVAAAGRPREGGARPAGGPAALRGRALEDALGQRSVAM